MDDSSCCCYQPVAERRKNRMEHTKSLLKSILNGFYKFLTRFSGKADTNNDTNRILISHQLVVGFFSQYVDIYIHHLVMGFTNIACRFKLIAK